MQTILHPSLSFKYTSHTHWTSPFSPKTKDTPADTQLPWLRMTRAIHLYRHRKIQHNCSFWGDLSSAFVLLGPIHQKSILLDCKSFISASTVPCIHQVFDTYSLVEENINECMYWYIKTFMSVLKQGWIIHYKSMMSSHCPHSKGYAFINWGSSWMEATFQMNVSKLPLRVLGFGATLCLLQKAVAKNANSELLWKLVGPYFYPVSRLQSDCFGSPPFPILIIHFVTRMDLCGAVFCTHYNVCQDNE